MATSAPSRRVGGGGGGSEGGDFASGALPSFTGSASGAPASGGSTPGPSNSVAQRPTAKSLFSAFPKALWKSKQSDEISSGSAANHRGISLATGAMMSPKGSPAGSPSSKSKMKNGNGINSMKKKRSDIPDGGLWPKGQSAKSNRPRKWSYGDLLTTRQAFWHCMTLVLGLGTLTIPYVLKELGWGGLVLLGLLAWLSAHTAKLLCICIDYVPEEQAGRGLVKVLNTYSDIGEAAYGTRGRQFVNCILYIDLVASSALFLIFIATNLEEIFPDVFTSIQWIWVTAITLLPTVWLKLQKLTFLSALGSYIMLSLVIAVLYATVTAAPSSLENNEYHIWRFRPQAAGNMIFAFAMHGTLLTIYRDMRTPKDAPALFNKIYFTGYALKFLIGATGYYLFAQNTSDQVSLNLPIPWLKAFITMAVTMKKWLTYALPLEPVAIELEQRVEGERSLFIRSVLVLLTVALAICLPYFGLFQSLVGSLCAGFLVLIFPLTFYLKLFGHKLSRQQKWIHVALLFASVILVGLASYRSIEDAFILWESSGVEKRR